MGNDVDYERLSVPDDKQPTEYTYTERRTEIYQLMKEAGHPKNLNQERLSNRYSVSHVQVWKDFQRLKEFRREHAGQDAVSTTEFVCEKAVRELMGDGEYKKAVDKQLDYMNWLYDEGIREKAPDKLDVDQTTTHELDDEDRSLALETIRELQQSDHDDE